MEYPKIETLFNRGSNFKVTDELRDPIYGIIKTWQVTEKIDGTNIRVILDTGGNMRFGGRTDSAQIPVKLLDVLTQMFNAEKMKEVFWKDGEPVDVTLYGEGYGAPIQKGGIYRATPSFRLFDVLIDNKWWLSWNNVQDVADKLSIKTAPLLGNFTLEEIQDMVRNGVKSTVALEDSNLVSMAEGIIGKTIEPLFDKHGHRVILKLKTKDY